MSQSGVKFFLKKWKVNIAFVFFLSSFLHAAEDSQGNGSSVSSNPAAVNLETGTGRLGRFLGIKKDSGIRLGGTWIADANYLIAGGIEPHKLSSNSLFVLSLGLDLQKLAGIRGASVGSEFLQFDGSRTNLQAGTVQGYNGLPGPPPLNRTELYQLWWRQELFNKKLVIRIGKTVPIYDFNNVMRPVVHGSTQQRIPSVTALIYTPIFVNPSMLGAIPGYYDSAVGITVNYLPTDNFYISAGIYDGNLARGRHTGIKSPLFNGYYFQIVESGASWMIGEDKKPGIFAVGFWNQTGKLRIPHKVSQRGMYGTYIFGSQRLWFQHPGKDNSGISAFVQFGINNSKILPVHTYVGGGLTAFGLVPGRLQDSMGFGFANSWLNSNLFKRSSELIIQGYYQANIVSGLYVEPVISYIPNPGLGKQSPSAWAATARMIALF